MYSLSMSSCTSMITKPVYLASYFIEAPYLHTPKSTVYSTARQSVPRLCPMEGKPTQQGHLYTY